MNIQIIEILYLWDTLTLPNVWVYVEQHDLDIQTRVDYMVSKLCV